MTRREQGLTQMDKIFNLKQSDVPLVKPSAALCKDKAAGC